MDSAYIIAALALFTIGGTLAAAVFHFGYFLKDPENVEAAKRVATDRESATTKLASQDASSRSLRQRLDDAPGINDSLSTRRAGLSPMDALTTPTLSQVRDTLKGSP